MKRVLSSSIKVFLIFAIVFSLFVILFDVAVYNYYSAHKSLQKSPISGRASNTGDLALIVEGDASPPKIIITDPENTTYTSHRTNLDYTASDSSGLSACWYSLNSGVINTTITCGNNVTGITSSEGGNLWRVYANDSFGNKNYSSVAFVVNIPVSGGGTPAAGGGGGGGGTTTVSVKSFDVLPKELNVFLVSNSQEEQEIRVINTGPVSVSIDIEVSGIDDFVSLNTNHISLAQNQKENLILLIKAPESGVHAGRIIFTSGNIRKEVFVLINVRSEGESLFDVSLTIPESYKTILPGNNIKAFVSLQQVGILLGMDITANYFIKDFDGNTVLTERATFFVYENEGFVKDFDTSKLPPGDYIAGVEIVYPGGFAASSSHFIISERIINKFILIAIILIILAILVIIYSIVKLRNKKKQNYMNLGARRK